MWKKLEDDYRQHGLVFALGAGVSLGCNLPDWSELLKRLAEVNGVHSLADILEAGFSLPSAAAVIERTYSDREEFSDSVRHALYREFPYYPNGYSKSRTGEFLSYVRTSNPTLRAVASFCGKKIATQKFEANPHVHGVITFNLDALLQAYTTARFRKRILRTVDRPSASSISGKISVYHVHGFLRYDTRAGERTKEAPDAMVLSENDYFDVFSDPTSLFTYAFLYLLREHPMLFVGLSMQDDNLRRLLHYSAREIRRAYEAEGVRVSESKILRHYAILERPKRDKLKGVIESSLAQLGVAALWLDDFKEIPDRLGALYETAEGMNWNDVW